MGSNAHYFPLLVSPNFTHLRCFLFLGHSLNSIREGREVTGQCPFLAFLSACSVIASARRHSIGARTKLAASFVASSRKVRALTSPPTRQSPRSQLSDRRFDKAISFAEPGLCPSVRVKTLVCHVSGVRVNSIARCGFGQLNSIELRMLKTHIPS